MNVYTERQLLDYLRCGVYYDIKYRLEIPLEEPERPVYLMEQACKHWMIKYMDGQRPGSGDIKAKWDQLAHGKLSDPKQVLDGMAQLMRFINWTQRERPEVLDVDMRYHFVAGNTEVVGLVPIVLSIGGHIELFIPDFGNRMPDQRIVDQKIIYSLYAAGFEKMNNKAIAGIRVHNFKHDRPLFSRRGADDAARLKSTVYNAGRGIAEQIFVPKESPLCESCSALAYCRGWRAGG